MRWWEGTIHVVDFEGTRASGVVEEGVITLRGGQPVAWETNLYRATGEVTASDWRVHGLRGNESDTPWATDANFREWTARRREGLLAAHHAPVEDGLLRAAWPYPPASPDWRDPARSVVSWGPWLDTRRLAEAVWPGLDSYTLGDLLATLDLTDSWRVLGGRICPQGRSHAHCALYDALGAALVLRRAAEESAWRDRTLPALLAALGAPPDAPELPDWDTPQ